jgi:hypothetical protein
MRVGRSGASDEVRGPVPRRGSRAATRLARIRSWPIRTAVASVAQDGGGQS